DMRHSHFCPAAEITLYPIFALASHASHSFDLKGSGLPIGIISIASSGLIFLMLVDFPVPDSPIYPAPFVVDDEWED
ncbi:hypothetical protein O5269_28890, partial [Escherichia coli]|nr:hypothetical protein [Escherichia coli]